MTSEPYNTAEALEAPYHSGVKAGLHMVRYNAVTKTGYLYLNGAADMSGAINLYKSIDPNVAAIYTYDGGKPDTAYLLKDGDWTGR
ncbi:hypothetical protein [Pararhizobium sp. O133]|uniref:hypothetical protein n=1 Tax=Pararhizobium sp. O133 TaxID=3449278 RepID=UPI003F6888C0